mgnify:CR=1 FL=1
MKDQESVGIRAEPRPAPRWRNRIGFVEAAFFDLDKTVIAKSSTLAFGRPLYRAGLLGRRALLKLGLGQLGRRVRGR